MTTRDNISEKEIWTRILALHNLGVFNNPQPSLYINASGNVGAGAPVGQPIMSFFFGAHLPEQDTTGNVALGSHRTDKVYIIGGPEVQYILASLVSKWQTISTLLISGFSTIGSDQDTPSLKVSCSNAKLIDTYVYYLTLPRLLEIYVLSFSVNEITVTHTNRDELTYTADNNVYILGKAETPSKRNLGDIIKLAKDSVK